MKDDRHGNRARKPSTGHRHKPAILRKQPAKSVRYGEQIATRGNSVWCAYDAEGALVSVAATADEVRRKYDTALRAREDAEYEARKLLKTQRATQM
jgi:hypothetical protein